MKEGEREKEEGERRGEIGGSFSVVRFLKL